MRESYFLQSVLYTHSCVATDDKQTTLQYISVVLVNSHFSSISLAFLNYSGPLFIQPSIVRPIQLLKQCLHSLLINAHHACVSNSLVFSV